MQRHATLRLLGHAFASLTAKRRENILKFTDPRFQSLLKDPASTSMSAMSYLGYDKGRRQRRQTEKREPFQQLGKRGSSNSSHHSGLWSGRQSKSSFS
ncbi:hypothetical protein OUZ56_029828 [Daphnia magna]|uniref:Uncharacterized protein n=1 Tax=Daphnia magna TaxID=35525 RepID=A0ABR0B7Y1_9CRUS|nr:hypothetical protein OUZ56_029828 [Daphnia magna]